MGLHSGQGLGCTRRQRACVVGWEEDLSLAPVDCARDVMNVAATGGRFERKTRRREAVPEENGEHEEEGEGDVAPSGRSLET